MGIQKEYRRIIGVSVAVSRSTGVIPSLFKTKEKFYIDLSPLLKSSAPEDLDNIENILSFLTEDELNIVGSDMSNRGLNLLIEKFGAMKAFEVVDFFTDIDNHFLFTLAKKEQKTEEDISLKDFAPMKK